MGVVPLMGQAFLSLLLSPAVRLSLKWTVQGLGMMRTYIPGEYNFRLHVWNNKAKVPGVSVLHTHPWDFHSHVLAGRLVNHTFTEISRDKLYPADGDLVVVKHQLKCGEGGGLQEYTHRIILRPAATDEYHPGTTYAEFGIIPHYTEYIDGTVTLVRRYPLTDGDPDMAYVYYLESEGWVSAEPRPATLEEIDEYCEAALARLGEVKEQ